MAANPIRKLLARFPITRRRGLREEDIARINPHLREALLANKRDGLLLAVRARWAALAVVALLIPYLNFTWAALYYEASIAGFALIGWAQLKVGRVATSRKELLLIFCDLALLTFIMVVPNPFIDELQPTAFQYRVSEFSYFYVFLAAATMAYSWRTIIAFGIWTTGLWMGAVILVILIGTEFPRLTDLTAVAYAGFEGMAKFMDPNDVRMQARVQDIVVFLIVAGILALNGRRSNNLLMQQAEVARERANLARHFPPTIVDQLAGQDQPLADVRSQPVAVMFVDIVGFTRLAEQQSPEDTVELLRQFHARMERAVFDQQGTLDKFLGDGLMATFGTPNPSDQDASNAVRCGRNMLADIENWNRERQASGVDPIKVSIGLHYGTVVLGDIGSSRRLEYAVLGDTVNVASRLEALTRNLGVRMALSEDLASAVRDDPADDMASLLAGLGSGTAQSLRGRDEPVAVWTL